MAIIALLLSAAAVAIDQIIKLLVLENLKPVGRMTVINNFFDLFYLENKGAAF